MTKYEQIKENIQMALMPVILAPLFAVGTLIIGLITIAVFSAAALLGMLILIKILLWLTGGV